MAPSSQTAHCFASALQSTAPSPRRQRRITENLGLVAHVMEKVNISNATYLNREDLFAAGVLGLIDAADRYDDSSNVQFTTYATTRIRGAILDEVRRVDWLPRNLRDEITRMQSAREKLHKQFGRPPSMDELAEELDMAPERLDSLASIPARESVPFPSEADSEGQRQAFMDYLGVSPRQPEPDPAERAEHEEALAHLACLTAMLPSQERLLVSLIYEEGMTLQQACEKMGLPMNRAIQLHKDAISRLRRGFGRIPHEGLPKPKIRKRKRKRKLKLKRKRKLKVKRKLKGKRKLKRKRAS